MIDKNIPLFLFPDAKQIVVCGDIHGDFNLLVHKMCVTYDMHDTLLIVAGDCGFGFETKGYYDNIFRRNSGRMNSYNNWIVFVRGNHDNPAYFDGKVFAHKRFLAVPDYSVIDACGHQVLCIGGAISTDRRYRKEWQKNPKHHIDRSYALVPNVYWENEAPVYNKELLGKIGNHYQIDSVVTHSAPSFCELLNKNGLDDWAQQDKSLLSDVAHERMTMDNIYEKLKAMKMPFSKWYYGHFHQSHHESIDGILFFMLDIMEITTLEDPRSVVQEVRETD